MNCEKIKYVIVVVPFNPKHVQFLSSYNSGRSNKASVGSCALYYFRRPVSRDATVRSAHLHRTSPTVCIGRTPKTRQLKAGT